MKNKHSGNCTIYSSLQNNHLTDGICTCGYGHYKQDKKDYAIDDMYSRERIEKGLEVEEGLNQDYSYDELETFAKELCEVYNKNDKGWHNGGWIELARYLKSHQLKRKICNTSKKTGLNF